MRTLALPLTALLFLGCTRPEVEAFQKRPLPMVVSFVAPDSGGPDVEKEYAAALRARLAVRTVVVPENVPPPAEAVELRVEINQLGRRERGMTGAQVGVVTGVAVGVLSAMAGDRNAFGRGLWWGLWVGHEAAHEDRMAARRDRFISPNRIRGRVSLVQKGVRDPLAEFDVDPEEVLNAMDPLRPSEQEDLPRLREEEAKAFARVVASRLSELFGWPVAREPMWYRAGAVVEK
jgi:hypothetical protein